MKLEDLPLDAFMSCVASRTIALLLRIISRQILYYCRVRLWLLVG